MKLGFCSYILGELVLHLLSLTWSYHGGELLRKVLLAVFCPHLGRRIIGSFGDGKDEQENILRYEAFLVILRYKEIYIMEFLVNKLSRPNDVGRYVCN